MHTEWDLLVLSESIEIGDCILVEDENGDTLKLKLIWVRVRPRHLVCLQDDEDEEHLFSGHTLEEIGGYRYILGKAGV